MKNYNKYKIIEQLIFLLCKKSYEHKIPINKKGDFLKKLLVILICFVLISVLGVALTVYDKKIAGTGRRRIPESTLMLIGLFGAALPMYLTMKKIRHKTKHNKFMIGLPAEVLLHVVIAAAIIYFSAAS